MLYVEACRSQGLAARFVSGYSMHHPPEVSEHELHAWAEVYLSGGGWRGYDPSLGLAVADGHGGAAYHHSDVGSAMACQVAAEVVADHLARLPAGGTTPGGADLMALRRWVAVDLPSILQQRWLAAVRQHWSAGPGRREAGAPFSPLPYGSTLGMLLLTPRWWAVAGLGDWDLVRVDPAGAAELLSQEAAAPGAGEATASLCQEGADLGGWFRSWVWPLEGQELPFALVLCTDGIRKSCASDADFLALTAWLAAGPEAELLREAARWVQQLWPLVVAAERAAAAERAVAAERAAVEEKKRCAPREG
jgi:hypothetical protein